MRTYTFYYCDSYDSYRKLDFKEFVVSASVFDIASKRFFFFLRGLDCEFISYASTYSLVTVTNKKSFRSFKESDLIHLCHIKDVHNASFWEKRYG